ncbi:MAG: response regulator [Acidobacteriia bacterium]|nr:response regulator [Terriglobia bacterium]
MSYSQLFATTDTSPSASPNFSAQTDLAHRVVFPPAKGPKLLWVDDSHILLSLYKTVFENLGFTVSAVSSPLEALSDASLAAVDAAILDYDMPEMNGATLAHRIKGRHPNLPVILYSGSNSIPQTANRFVDAICAKGAPREELLSTIERLACRTVNSPEDCLPYTLRPRQITLGEPA